MLKVFSTWSLLVFVLFWPTQNEISNYAAALTLTLLSETISDPFHNHLPGGSTLVMVNHFMIVVKILR